LPEPGTRLQEIEFAAAYQQHLWTDKATPLTTWPQNSAASSPGPPPRVFQGPTLWDVAQQALLGVNVTSQLDDYLRATFQMATRRGRQRHRGATSPESGQKREKREYATTQERFKKRQADCARTILDGPCAATVSDRHAFLESWRS
ncbi:unnamed protein product, partial [Ixodes hexagonus]